jgi:predicted NAD/FAD-dependent oxidoreductase
VKRTSKYVEPYASLAGPPFFVLPSQDPLLKRVTVVPVATTVVLSLAAPWLGASLDRVGPERAGAVRGRADARSVLRWFGPQVEGWRHLRTYRIAYALPDQRPGCLDPVERPVRVHRWLFVCGDWRETGSLQGALASGRRAAEAVAESLAP